MPTVLLIDDEAMIRDVVRAHLEAVKFDVTEARDGREGVARLLHAEREAKMEDLIHTQFVHLGKGARFISEQVVNCCAVTTFSPGIVRNDFF